MKFLVVFAALTTSAMAQFTGTYAIPASCVPEQTCCVDCMGNGAVRLDDEVVVDPLWLEVKILIVRKDCV